MNADLVVVGALVLLWAFGGMVQTYSSIINSLGQFGMLLNYISPFKWSMELQVCVWIETRTVRFFEQYPQLTAWNDQILLEMRTYDAPLWPTEKVYKVYSYDA